MDEEGTKLLRKVLDAALTHSDRLERSNKRLDGITDKQTDQTTVIARLVDSNLELRRLVGDLTEEVQRIGRTLAAIANA